MKASEHMARAEELLGKAEALLDGPRCHHAREYAMAAQAHATLALVAATYHTANGTVPADRHPSCENNDERTAQ